MLCHMYIYINIYIDIDFFFFHLSHCLLQSLKRQTRYQWIRPYSTTLLLEIKSQNFHCRLHGTSEPQSNVHKCTGLPQDSLMVVLVGSPAASSRSISVVWKVRDLGREPILKIQCSCSAYHN